MRPLIWALCLCTVSLFAQKSDYDFNIKDNKVEKSAYDLSLKLNPAFTDYSYDNTVGGYSSSLFFRISTIMALHGEYFGSYYNVEPAIEKENTSVTTYNGVAANGYVPFQYYKVGATIYLFSRPFEGRVKVSLPSEKRNGSKQRYFFEVDGVEKLRQLGLRASAGQFQGQAKERDGEFDGANPDPLGDPLIPLNNVGGDNYTSLSYNLFSLGFSYEQLNHVTINIKTDSIGMKPKRNHWRIYADFLVAQQIKLDDIRYTWDESGILEEEVYELQKYTVPKFENDVLPYLGYRAGFEYNTTGKVGFTYGLEVGARPGMGSMIARSFFSAKVGVSFNWKLIKY